MKMDDRLVMGLLAAAVCFCLGTLEAVGTDDQRAEEPMLPAAATQMTGWSYRRIERTRIAVAPAAAAGDYGEDPDEAEKIEAALVEQGYFREDVPLDFTLQDILQTECEKNGIPYAVALGLIEVESGFQAGAVNEETGCYGLCQLNPLYFPNGLDPAENIVTGMACLGENIQRYDGDLAAALTAYNAGHDTGSREYAEKVLAAAEGWRAP